MGKKEDLTNQIFGDFKVVKFDDTKGKYKYYWICECVNCGKQKSICTSSLKDGKSITCICNDNYNKPKNIKGFKEDLSGKKFGHLLVKSFAYKLHSHSYWNCICDCGNECIKSISYLNKSKYLMCNDCMHCYTKKDKIIKEKEYIPFEEIAYQTKENKVEIQGDITILNDKIIIDTKNLDKILSFKRYVSVNSSGYPYMNWKGRELFLHRFIMGLPQEYDKETMLIAEHKNGNRLECLENNLRICKKNLNPINCKIYKNNTSGYKGISWLERLNKWQVNLQYKKEKIYLGVYENLEDAIKFRKEAEEKYFGEYNRKKEDLYNG